MEDMLRFARQLFVAQKKCLWFPRLVAYTTFFHIMEETLHSCKLAGELDNKAVSQRKALACSNCW